MTKTAREHWEAVAQEMFAEDEQSALNLAKKLQKYYERAKRQLEKDINAFYGKYAKDNKLDIHEVQKLLNSDELKDFRRQIDEYIALVEKYPDNEAYLAKLKLLKTKARLTRLEELKANIEYEIATLQMETNMDIEEFLQEAYENAYLKSIYNMDKYTGLSFTFAKPNTQAVKNYLSRHINIANYSIGAGGVWAKTEQLTDLLYNRIPQGMILGYNPKKVAQLAYQALGTNYNNAVRLVRTEYNYTYNQATKDGYQECGVEQYQVIVALDERTCETCGKLDLLIQNYDDIIVGVNYPTFHPNCRCTTIPYFDPEMYGKRTERIAKDENGKNYMVPADLTWAEWKAGLTEHQGGAQYYKPKEA